MNIISAKLVKAECKTKESDNFLLIPALLPPLIKGL